MTRERFQPNPVVGRARPARVAAPLLAAVLLATMSSITLAPPVRIPVRPGPIHRPDGDGSDAAAAVKKFLAAKRPKAGWNKGPVRMQNDAIDKAYPGLKFYYVFSSMYPVGRAGLTSAMVRIDKKGKLAVVASPADFSDALMEIKSAEDAKTAAAAVLSLVMTWRGPLSLKPDEFTVKKSGDGGWQCTASRGRPVPRPGVIRPAFGGIQFFADFDATGKCTRAKIDDRSPRPICIGGLFWAVGPPENVPAGLTHPIGGGLLTASVEPDSIAAKAGLKRGDLIVSFNNEPLPPDDTIQQMRQIVFPLKQNGHVERSIIVVRNGRLARLKLKW